MSQQANKLQVSIPRWVCAGAILFGSSALVVQAVIDIYQGTHGFSDFPSAAFFAQAWQMALPTGFTLIFAAIGGCFLYARRWVLAAGLYAIVFGYMAVTASNSMDFVADQTVARTKAAQDKQEAAKDIASIRNNTVLQERKEKIDTLWRTYSTAAKVADKEKALAEIEKTTKEPPTLQQIDVEVVQVGSGSIFSRRWGWQPEAIQELKAIGLPILVMIGKALGITLGFAFWTPEGVQSNSVVAPLLPPKARQKPREMSIDEARKDLKALIASKSELPKGGRGFARRWRVHDSTAGEYLDEFRKEGFIRRVQSGPLKLVVPVHSHTNGSGNVVSMAGAS